MTADSNFPARRPDWTLLTGLFVVALVVRIGGAIWLQQRAEARGTAFEFADSELYWKLGLQLAAGQPYDDGRRLAQRTPGYPLFLAASIRIMGPTSIGARHLQASVGALSVALLWLLVHRLTDAPTAWVAAGLAVIYPFAVFLSVVLLSEALFTAVLLTQLHAAVRLWVALGYRTSVGATGWSLATGLLGAAATLIRPSWFFATTTGVMVLAFTAWAVEPARRFNKWRLICVVCIATLGFSFGMAPWWMRNYDVFGRPVLTTLWVGASLYDGLSPHATGASDMRFLDEPVRFGLPQDLGGMSELDQDSFLRAEALRFARNNPGRFAELSVIKFLRFWNPIPNAQEWGSSGLRAISLLSYGPVLVLASVGIWSFRHRVELILLLGGPVVYFSAVHSIFVSSVRYREAAMLPVLGLTAMGAIVVARRVVPARLRGDSPPSPPEELAVG